MLSEVGKLRPASLILWKADRLGRDRYNVAIARKTLRDAGCRVIYVADNLPEDDSPEAAIIESLVDAMSEMYSRQLSANVKRGSRHNAERALSNGHKIYGYGTDDKTKRYVIDQDTAPIVRKIFSDYASGKRLQVIVDELNAGRFEENKRIGRQASRGTDEDGTPRFWLTGHLTCGVCGSTLCGTHGRSKTGRNYYYYACVNHIRRRKGKCAKRSERVC